jgi:hypothetical protein
LTAEVHAFVRPVAGVIALAPERIQARILRQLGGGKAASGHDAKPGGDRRMAIGVDLPKVARFIENRGRDARIQHNIVAQLEPIRDVVEIPQDFCLRGVTLGPFPLAVQFLRKGVGIFEALYVAARTRIAVPEPGAANAAAGFVDTRGETKAAQAMQHVEPGKSGANDDGIVMHC